MVTQPSEANEPATPDQPSATKTVFGRRKWFQRILVATTLAVGVVAALLIFAPLQTRWLVAAGMKQVYAFSDDNLSKGRADNARPGLTLKSICERLDSQSEAKWTVQIDQPQSGANLKAFAHEDLQHPSVVKFRNATADLVPETFDVFEVARRVRKLTQHRTDFHGHDVWECLGAARSGRGLWCHHFCRIFASVCTSRGYTTRIVSLSQSGGHFDHAACEVFLPQMGGWMLIDVDFEVAYRAHGRWLTAVDLQRIWQTVRDDIPSEHRFDDAPEQSGKRRSQIVARHGLEVVEFGDEERHLRDARFEVSPTGLNLELFEYVFLAVRNDYLSRSYPFAHPYRIGQVCFRADQSNELIEVCPEAHYVPSQTVYEAVGSTRLKAEAVTDKFGLKLCFETTMPNFQEFQLRHNHLGNWEPMSKCLSEHWALTEKTNVLEVRAVNKLGVFGPTTSILATQSLESVSELEGGSQKAN